MKLSLDQARAFVNLLYHGPETKTFFSAALGQDALPYSHEYDPSNGFFCKKSREKVEKFAEYLRAVADTLDKEIVNAKVS